VDPKDVDPELLGQWLAISAMLASAQETHARGGGGWPPLAVVAADTACEALLSMVAARGIKPPNSEAKWPELYSAAVATFRGPLKRPMSESLMRRLKTLHSLRNAAVHDGTDPGRRAVETALSTAADLRSHAVAGLELLEVFRTAGPIALVGHLVGVEPIASALIAAEAHLANDELIQAADEAAIALEAAIERVKPGLRSYRGLPYARQHERVDALDNIVREQTRLHEAWILAIGLGLRPIELRRLERLLGDPQQSITESRPSNVLRREGVVLTRPLVEWAVRLLADVVFRLWLSESLSPAPWPYLDKDDE
jgi:hypothetical protein